MSFELDEIMMYLWLWNEMKWNEMNENENENEMKWNENEMKWNENEMKWNDLWLWNGYE